MLGKRPATYVEWRACYHEALKLLGSATLTLTKYRMAGMGSMVIRTWWVALSRAARIDRRLDAEHEACDETLAAEIVLWAMTDTNEED